MCFPVHPLSCTKFLSAQLTTHSLLVPTRKQISVSNTATCFHVHPITLHFLYFTHCQWLTFVLCIYITPLPRLTMPPRKKRKSLKEDDKQKNPPEVVGMKYPVDPNPTLDGATSPKPSKKKKSVPNDAHSEVSEDGKQPGVVIVVAQRTDGVAVAGMKHSFPLRGVCDGGTDIDNMTWKHYFPFLITRQFFHIMDQLTQYSLIINVHQICQNSVLIRIGVVLTLM